MHLNKLYPWSSFTAYLVSVVRTLWATSALVGNSFTAVAVLWPRTTAATQAVFMTAGAIIHARLVWFALTACGNNEILQAYTAEKHVSFNILVIIIIIVFCTPNSTYGA